MYRDLTRAAIELLEDVGSVAGSECKWGSGRAGAEREPFFDKELTGRCRCGRLADDRWEAARDPATVIHSENACVQIRREPPPGPRGHRAARRDPAAATVGTARK